MKRINPQIQRPQQTPRIMKKTSPMHIIIIIKLFKSNKKEKILKTAREKKTCYKQKEQ